MRVEFLPRALRRIELVDAWWRHERPKAPDLFRDELDKVIELLAGQPRVGTIYRVVRGQTFHRVLLPKSRQHVYYSIDEDDQAVVIQTVWGAARGRGPTL